MTRPFETNPVLPNIEGPIGEVDGKPVFLVEEWRQYFEQDNLTVSFNGADLVKQANDGVDSLNTDYYTKAQVNSLLGGKANVSHTHAASDITSGTLADARIPTLAISKVTGLQAALDGKVDESAFGTVTAGTTLTNSHYLDLTLPNGQVFRIHGELLP